MEKDGLEDGIEEWDEICGVPTSDVGKIPK